VKALKPPCAEAVEFDQAWVKQDPKVQLYEVMCRVAADTPTPDCPALIELYRRASPIPMPRINLFVVDPEGAERCRASSSP
jgi:hypothetical protein